MNQEIESVRGWIRGLRLWRKFWMLVASLVFFALFGIAMVRVFAITPVENYQIAYKFQVLFSETNAIEVLKDEKGNYRRGWILHWPIIVKINTVDLRPMQVTMNANSRVLNAKLVKFNPDGLDLFLSWHGRSDYEGPGGNTQGSTDFSEILKSYAYDGNTYPFLTILRDLKSENSDYSINEGEKSDIGDHYLP